MLQPAGPVPVDLPAGPVPVDPPASEIGHPASRLLRLSLYLYLVARRLGHPAAQVDHSGGGHRAQGEQHPPRHIVTDPRAEQGQCDKRPDDEPERLRGEHHPDQLAAVLPVGVLADHHGADRIVTADAEPEHETEHDQHPVGGRLGEEPHPRRQHRPQMEPAQRGLIERSDQVPGPHLGHGISPAAYAACIVPRASCFPSAAAEAIRLRQRAADLEMNEK